MNLAVFCSQRLALVSLIASLFTLVGCGGQSNGASSGSSNDQTSTLTWSIQNTCNFTTYVRFFDKTDNSSYWPANGSYILEAGKTYSVALSCKTHDQICNGGSSSTDGTTDAFGVGLNNTQGCQGCCDTCTTHTTNTIEVVQCQ